MAEQIAPELVERMVALVRDVNAERMSQGNGHMLLSAGIVARTAAIVAELPKPIDPDLLEARRLGDKHTNNDKPGKYQSGIWDDRSSTKALLEAIKRGRELEREGK